MNILHICISERYVEGDSYHENILPTKHQKMGHNVTVIASQTFFDGRTKCMRHREVADYINKDGLHIIILPSIYGDFLKEKMCKSVLGLYGKIEETSPEVIFVHGVGSPDNRAVAKYMKRHKNVKLFADSHNDYHVTPKKKGLKHYLYRCISAKNARILLPYIKTYWGTLPLRATYLHDVYKIPKNKIGVLVMGGDESLIVNRDVEDIRYQIRENYGIPKNAFLVVTGGAFDERKQQNLLMEAVKQLAEKNIYLLAFGEPVKGMESVFNKYKTERNIIMTGWLPSDKAYDMFLASNLAFFPGWHSVLWEQAVACGIPLVVKYWEGVDHININNNAVLMNEVDVGLIKETILSLLFTPKYGEMLKCAKEAAPDFYMCNIANKAIGE